MEIREGFCFDDLLLVPKYSEIESRSKVDLSLAFSKKGIDIRLKHPVIPANMATICEYEMAEAIWKSGGMAFLHRFMKPEEQLAILQRLEQKYGRLIWIHIGVSVGVKEADYEIVKMFIDNGVEIICIDVAHGDSFACVQMCQFISTKYPEVLLIAGNVATGEGAKRLWMAGADLVKVGIGSGTICSTRLETGCGVPQLSALMDAARVKKDLTEDYDDYEYCGQIERHVVRKAEIDRPIGIISDGGCSKPADICKSLCFADLTMIGGMVAGTDECPTSKVEHDGEWYKRYDGSSTYKGNRIEGVKALVPYKGPVQKVLDRIFDGLQSCCSYQGVSKVSDLQKDPQFVRISNSGLIESNIHNVQVIRE